MTLNGNRVTLPNSVTINFRDKFKIRSMIEGEPLLFYIMLRQGFSGSHWLPTILQKLKSHHRYSYTHGLWLKTSMQVPLWLFPLCPPGRYHQCWGDSKNPRWNTLLPKRSCHTIHYLQPMGYTGKTISFAAKEDKCLYGREKKTG